MELEKLKVKRLLITLTSDDEINAKDYADAIEEACSSIELRPRPLGTKLDISIQEVNVDWVMKSPTTQTAPVQTNG